jgi:FkbM family methyltransferase
VKDTRQRKWGTGPIAEFIELHGLRSKFQSLDPEAVATVHYRGQTLKFHIPDAMTDKMQLAALMGALHEARLLERFAALISPDGVVLDLGANHGSHTIFFGAVMKARLVHAFEPQARLADILRVSVMLNGLDNVIVHQAAVGAKSGRVSLASQNEENSGMAAFRPDHRHGDIPMVAIDDVVTEMPVTGVKIDVEGMQMPALRGMARTIRRDRPVIWIELRPAKGEVPAPTEWLMRHGYRAHQISFRDFFFLPEPLGSGLTTRT